MNYSTKQEAEAAANLQSKQMELDSETIGFDGNNCHETQDPDDFNCDGWDGNSRRCDCGNRRVGWSFVNSLRDGTWSYYAEAY